MQNLFKTHHQLAYCSQKKIHQHNTCLKKTNESEPSIQESLELAQSYVLICHIYVISVEARDYTHGSDYVNHFLQLSIAAKDTIFLVHVDYLKVYGQRLCGFIDSNLHALHL